MKKLIALTLVIIICFSAFSCAKITQWQLDKNAIAFAAEKKELSLDVIKSDEYKTFLQKLEVFSTQLTAEMTQKYGKDDNFVISPISIYMGLALAIECATGETRQEILDAVGVTYEEVNKYTSGLYANANKEYIKRAATGNKKVVAYQMLNNSIWLDKDVKFVEEGINNLASNYNCDVFSASFQNGEAERLIEKYIETKTNGLIDADVEFSPETYFVLMNTYYLKEIWNEFGDSLDFTSEKYTFKNTDGSTNDLRLLKSYYSNGKAYKGENYSSFFITTEHSFNIYFFVPNNENKVSDVFTSENINAVLSMSDWGHVDDENRQLHHTRVLFPEFDADFDEDISDVLSEKFGVKRLFTPDACEMSNISENDVYCQGMMHLVELKVDKKGIEGASIVYIPGAGSAAPPPYEKVYHDFVVDKAFGFVITDSYGTVVFSGVVNELD